MSDVVVDPNTGLPVEDEEVDAPERDARFEREIPQGPGDEGYEPPLIVPELDLEGGTKFVVGEDEYESMTDAAEAIAPPDATDVEDVEEPTDPEAPVDTVP